MAKRPAFAFPVLLLAIFFGDCTNCNDCDEPRSYNFSNNSSYDIALTSTNSEGDTVDPSAVIPKNMLVTVAGKNDAFLGAKRFVPDSSVAVKIKFASVPERCLIYSGPISDPGGDIRSPSAYRQGEAFDFTIDDSHFDRAGSCP